MDFFSNKKTWHVKLGLILMISSGVFFAAGLIIPVTNLNIQTRVVLSTASFILMEIVFWTGGLLVGKELFIRYRSYLNPVKWFKNNRSAEV
jgi:hypothetical protein